MAKFFRVTIDRLLSSDELLTLAQEDSKQTKNCFLDLVFGLLDTGASTFLFLPLFGQRESGIIQSVPLLSLTEISPYLKIVYYAVVIGIVGWGILTLALQSCEHQFWVGSKRKISLALNSIGIIIFILSLQPYASILLFMFLAVKALLLTKKQ